MPKKSGWDLLQSGDLQAALRLLKAEHKRNPFKGTLNNLGICYLKLGEAVDAKKMFDEALSMPLRDSGTHGLAGISRWIMNGAKGCGASLWCGGFTRLPVSRRKAGRHGTASTALLCIRCAVPEVFPVGRAKELIRRNTLGISSGEQLARRCVGAIRCAS